MSASIDTKKDLDVPEEGEIVDDSSSDESDFNESDSLNSGRAEHKAVAFTNSSGSFRENLPQMRRKRSSSPDSREKRMRDETYNYNQHRSVSEDNWNYRQSYHQIQSQFEVEDFESLLKLQIIMYEKHQEERARMLRATDQDFRDTSSYVVNQTDSVNGGSFQGTCVSYTNDNFDSTNWTKPYTLIPISRGVIDYTRYKLVSEFEQLRIDPRLNQPARYNL